MIPFGFHSRIHSQRARRRMDLAVDVRLAHPARDELGELGAEVEDQDAVVVLGALAIVSDVVVSVDQRVDHARRPIQLLDRLARPRHPPASAVHQHLRRPGPGVVVATP